jgi:hypothetical protein
MKGSIMPILLLIIAIIFVLVLAFLAVIAYVSVVASAKVLGTVFNTTLGASSLPHSVKRPLQEARRYAELIRTTVQQCPPGPMKDRLNLTIEPVNEWITNLNRLEQALRKLYSQRNLNRELRRVNYELEQLHRQLLTANREEAVSVRALMKSKKQHRAVLNELLAFQNQAELKIRKIASDLGTTHTEVLLVTARGDFNQNRIQRLDENLQENMSSLRDILSAMDDMGYSSAVGY